MCCFSGPVEKVEATNIHARMMGAARQLLVYEMRIAARAEVAMILPIPVPAGTAEDAVRFHSLEHYPTVFEDLDLLFRVYPRSRSAEGALAVAPPLAVHSVGAFEASFVPALADFARLDPRFRFAPGTIDRVPAYADWGFAVFQLAPTKGLASVHPMAFDFPTREPSRLFFPTVHVHDGQLHAEAEFAHQLYAQGVERSQTWPASPYGLEHLRESRRVQKIIAKRQRTEDLFELLFDGDAPLTRHQIFGTHPNTDTWAALRA